MKRLLILTFFLLSATFVFAQQNVVPQTIAPFRILNVADSTYYTPADLKKNKPTVIIYFAPDCDHCDQFTKEILSKIKGFNNAQMVFITFAQYQATKNFVKKYNLNKHPNITVGTEGYTYTVQRFYKISTTPFTAVYNKNGQLVKTFAKNPKVEEVIALLK